MNILESFCQNHKYDNENFELEELLITFDYLLLWLTFRNSISIVCTFQEFSPPDVHLKAANKKSKMCRFSNSNPIYTS